MASMNGAETFREIGRVGPEAFVVVVTAYPDSTLMSGGTPDGPIGRDAKAVRGGGARGGLEVRPTLKRGLALFSPPVSPFWVILGVAVRVAEFVFPNTTSPPVQRSC